jgi:hypothetical protein
MVYVTVVDQTRRAFVELDLISSSFIVAVHFGLRSSTECNAGVEVVWYAVVGGLVITDYVLATYIYVGYPKRKPCAYWLDRHRHICIFVSLGFIYN